MVTDSFTIDEVTVGPQALKVISSRAKSLPGIALGAEFKIVTTTSVSEPVVK
ncbi:hypothetical protein [Flavobacterium hibisci]|uniref:hypothetical protein n=1 Tax=Flavobacterium hibisci TaxID=1914462 RepID=UPI001CC08A48|nr:hypothetical protein [Flavobacterium hibisci]MBZ4040995.1 hypothetical protein [Flavobacterium hibisci]